MSRQIVPPDGAPTSTQAPRQLPHQAPKNPGHLQERQQEQQWLDIRFSGITPTSMHANGVAVVSACNLNPPKAFQNLWYTLGTGSFPFPMSQLQGCGAILILANPTPEQMEPIHSLARFLNTNNADDCPPIFFVPQMTMPEHGGNVDASSVQSICQQVLDFGVDDIIPPETQGLVLAMTVKSKINQQIRLGNQLRYIANTRRAMNAQVKFLEDSIDNVFWNYLRMRLKTGIPQVTSDWPAGLPQTMEGFTVGTHERGRGNTGAVHELLQQGRPSGQVVKCMPKEKLANVPCLKYLKNQIAILKMLTNDAAHPNIIKLYEVHHCTSHIILRMEDGGPCNLFERLKQRVNGQQLQMRKVITLIRQINSAIAHLHSRKVVHRDIKPENICVHETDEEITTKLIDFDCTLRCEHDAKSSFITGTFPFTAPEVYLEDCVHPHPTDIWSLGVMHCEILCGLHFLDRVCQLKAAGRWHEEQCRQNGVNASNLDTLKFLMGKIKAKFEDIDSAIELMEGHVHPEVQPLVGPWAGMFNGMLRLPPAARWTAGQVLGLSNTALHLDNFQEEYL